METTKTATYQEWIQFLFDHDESQGDWRFDSNLKEIRVTEIQIVDFVTRMFENFEKDVAKYSDWQIGMGLDYVFNGSCSDFAFALRDKPAPLEKRLAAIQSLKLMYAHCFETRCEPVLGHWDERGNSLNHICYMLWDVTPLDYFEGNPDGQGIHGAVIDVMKYALSLSNIACIESGLHGLGHLTFHNPQAAQIIQAFIKNAKGLDSRLLSYAQAAQTGYIQ